MKTFIRLLAVILIIPLTVFAQNDIIINVTVYEADILEVLYAADLDLMQQGTGRELFMVNLTNTIGQEYNNCIMNVRITKDGSEISAANSELFKIPAGVQSYQMNNVDLINNTFAFNLQDDATRIRFKKAQVSSEVEGLQKELLTTGKVPIGAYFLIVDIVWEGDIIGTVRVPLLHAINPSFVQPILPGVAAGSGMPADIYTQYPVFQWNGNGTDYEVMVFESRPGLSSMDDILNSAPSWKSERISGFSIQYPPVNAVPMEYGRNYYWLVKMYVHTSSGEEVVNSEIYQFRMVDPTNMDQEIARLVKLELIEFLREFIGDEADDIARKLEDYDFSKIYLNGEAIPLDELRQHISSGKYKKGEFEVVDLDLR
ncbi:MAG: hypothetical protein JXR46_01685 [Calditrichaceae bacterium]|nr:hypothetical protein [Calditrichaceae bacterium]MBN2707730.1 hypothetical protein [Calditrichaceae bacterium]RQV96455.1 MAG: hypothetical protein EH224_04355 [Calditrichota bacterium]